MRNLQRITFRTNPRGLRHLPLGVRSTGHYRVDRHYREHPKKKGFCQIFWGIAGRARFQHDGKSFEIGGGDIFIYRPGDVHDFRPLSTVWEYCWLTLDHADITAWLSGFGLKGKHPATGNCPIPLFTRLRSCLAECTPQGEREAANIAHAILTAATSNISEPEPDSLAARARDLIDEHFTKANWGISDVVSFTKVHRTTLLRSFLKHYGLNPSRYLQNRRLQKALSLLRENELQIQEIASLAGFSDSNYLARLVHQATGLSPREFRKQ